MLLPKSKIAYTQRKAALTPTADTSFFRLLRKKYIHSFEGTQFLPRLHILGKTHQQTYIQTKIPVRFSFISRYPQSWKELSRHYEHTTGWVSKMYPWKSITPRQGSFSREIQFVRLRQQRWSTGKSVQERPLDQLSRAIRGGRLPQRKRRDSWSEKLTSSPASHISTG